MALPKGVKSPVDYTKLYMSNELDGKVLLEKEKMSALDKRVYSKIYDKAGTTKVTDYSTVPNKFRNLRNFERMGGISGFGKRRLSTSPTKFKKPVVSVSNFASKNMRGFSKTSMAKGGLISKVGKGAVNVLSKMGPKGRLAAAAITGLALASKPISNKLKEVGKKIKGAAIDKQVDKYVKDRKSSSGIKKVPYKNENQYTVTRDDKGKVTGTGKLIRVEPGTRTIQRMPTPDDKYKKSRLSQHTGSPFKSSPLNRNKNIYGLKTEATMTPAQKRKDTMLKKKYEKSDDMMKSFKDQYGKEKGENVFYAYIRKKSMEPKKVEEKLDKKDIPFLKDLAGKLSDGAKKHKRQSEKIKLALNTEDTAIESELVIQDWNKDDIKFTEIETVDIIKAKPLKESMSNWREELGEDWQKVNRKDKTDGLSRKAVKAYRRENPGSKLQTAVTKDPKKLKKGSKSAKRRLSFCRRMKGMKKKLTSAKTRRDPDSRINKALRRWNC